MSDPKMILIRKRKSFSKLESLVEVPNLIAVQSDSYERFLQRTSLPDKREDIGLQAAFSSIFPIEDYNGIGCLEFVDYSLGFSKYDEAECLQRGITYSIPLKIRVRLILWDREDSSEKKIRDIKEQEIYLGDIPLMTDSGTFIINGTERVVVSQLHRSPGVFFSHDKGKTHVSGNILYSARIIPARGSWLDMEFDSKDILYVRIDRRRKIPVTILMKAFGLNTETVLREFYPVEPIIFRGGKSYLQLDANLHSGIRTSFDIADPASGDILLKEGNKITRAVLKRMLAAGITEVELSKADLLGKVVLSDIIDTNTGEVILEILGSITEDIVEKIMESNIPGIEVAFMDNVHFLSVICDTLRQENIRSVEEAKVEIYKRLRPGETPTVETAKTFFESLFFNSKRYDLSEVGRLKINKRLNLEVPLDTRTLTRDDIVFTTKKIIQLKSGKGVIDDIDHLGNRRVRSVGELVETQFRVGLVRIERTIKERMNLIDIESAMPHDLINSKPVVAVIREFFGGSQLSQFMDQTNPLSEITHKRRLSALGPGGLTRERAGFEVRDVHSSHYGRICPIETPEGPNIGLVTSLATYAKVNRFGFIETPCFRVKNRKRVDEVVSLSAIDGDKFTIAQANTALDKDNNIVDDSVNVRCGGDFLMINAEKVEYMDVSPKQVVSVATALIPFLEHDDANRALMGSNMQRQAVPVLKSEAPIVGTGMEAMVARDSGYMIFANRAGIVEQVDSTKVIIRSVSENGEFDPAEPVKLAVHDLIKHRRTNQSTCFNQTPIVNEGDFVEAGYPIVDGPSMDKGELALGKNVLVAFMPWGGYNFEDAILVSERMTKEDVFTSIHIEEFEVDSRDTKLGKEEITRDIPNIGEETLKNLDSSGIIRIGAEVKPGDVLVGKVTPKGETQLTPEEKLLRAIFGEKAGDVKDTSLLVPSGVHGVVVDVKVFARKGVEKDERIRAIEEEEYRKHERAYEDAVVIISRERRKMLKDVLSGMSLHREIELQGGEVLAEGHVVTDELIYRISMQDVMNLPINDPEKEDFVKEIVKRINDQLAEYQKEFEDKVEKIKRGTELPPGVIKMVKVYITIKRKLSVGDKMAGRHGNKGVVSMILPEEDMPFLPDGRPVDIVLNPLGVPSRMNVGQILEVHLAWAAKALGLHIATPVFDGANEAEIKSMLQESQLPTTGKMRLIDGRTGEALASPVTVGYMYIMKLHHLVDDKIHARSVGPYSLVTQQPLGGKAQFGGQRLGEMEVWALQAYGAASILQEFLTVKSDDVQGRSKIYEAIIKGENFLEPGLPESFNVLIKELQSLCLDVELES